MTDKPSPLMISRRSFLAGIGASGLPPKNFGSLLNRGTLEISDAASEAFYSNPKYQPLVHWLASLFDQASENRKVLSIIRQLQNNPAAVFPPQDAQSIAWRIVHTDTNLTELNADYMSAGLDLIKQRPSLALVQEIVHHPVFQGAYNYNDHTGGASIENAIINFFRTSQMSIKHLMEIVSKEAHSYKANLETLTQLGRLNPSIAREVARQESSKENEIEKKTNLQTGFGNMAAARKAAMYPIPRSVTDEEQKKLRIGLYAQPYASGCEHYGTIGPTRDEQLSDHYTCKPAR